MTAKPIPKGIKADGAITKYMDRRFLSSVDLIGHTPVTLTIDRLEIVKDLKFENGQVESSAKLLYFKETKEKPLVIKTTNINLISLALETNKPIEWEGKKIILDIKTVRTQSGMKPAVRVIDKG